MGHIICYNEITEGEEPQKNIILRSVFIMVKMKKEEEKKVVNFRLKESLVKALSEFIKVEKSVGNIESGLVISDVVEKLFEEALTNELESAEYKKDKEYYLQLQAKKKGHKAEIEAMENPKTDNIKEIKKAG